MLDVMADQLESTCKQLEQQYGKDKVLMLLCDVTDSKKLVGDLGCCLRVEIPNIRITNILVSTVS